MGRWGRRERGSYALELVGVFLGVAVLLVSVADVVRIFQARAAVRAAVHDGLRCLYPTDAGCSDLATFAPTSPWKRFNVSVWGSGYRIPRESYVATARWLTEPVYEVPVDQRELVAVNLERDPYQYASYDVLYPTVATSAYLLQTRALPRVNNGTPFDPYFVDPISRERATSSKTISLAAVKATTSDGTGYWETDGFKDRFKIGSVSFSMKDAWPSADADRGEISALRARGAATIDCYSGPLSRDATGLDVAWGEGNSEACVYRGNATGIWRNNALSIPLMFRVSGSTKGTSRLGDGRVLLRMSWRGSSGDGSVTLGGRRINSGSSGNFVPRGLAWEDIRDNIERQYQDYRDEIDLYGTLPLIPWDSTVTIEFFLVSVNKRPVTWSGDSVEVFYPRYQLRKNMSPCGDTRDPNACVTRPEGPLSLVTVPPDATFKLATVDATICSAERRNDVEPSAQGALDRITERVRSGEALAPARVVVPTALDRGACRALRERWPCVSTPPDASLRGCEREEAPSVAVRRCGVPDGIAKLSRFLSSEWRASSDALSKEFRGCSGPRPPDCALPHARRVNDQVWYPAPGDSETCAEAEARAAPALTVGPLTENACLNRAAEIQSAYRAKEKVPAGVAITLVRTINEPLFSVDAPPDSCTPSRPAEGTDERLVCGRGISAARANRCCAAAQGRCEREEVVSSGSVETDYTHALIDVATRRVVEGVQAGYPRARFQDGCQGDDIDCVTVSAAVSPEDLTAKVSARLTIPLRVLRVVAGRESSIEYAAERKLERSVFAYE